MVGVVPSIRSRALNRRWLAVGLLVGSAWPLLVAHAGADPGRYVEDQVRVAGVTHRFLVWLPPGHTAARRTPGIVFLHGSGECGDDPVAPTRIGLGPRLEESPGRWPFIVVFPQKPRDSEEWEEREALVLAATDLAIRRYGMDPARVALAGMSQGGHGTWLIGARHPQRWSCLVPICGYGRGRTVGPRIAALPVWAFHGLRDDIIDPRDTEDIVQWAREARAKLGLDPEDIRKTMYPEANHGSWEPALREPDLPAWILAAPPRGAAR